MASPVGTVKIALVGKYVDLPDAYLSVTEALRHAGAHHRVKVDDPVDGVRRAGRRRRATRRRRRHPRPRRIRRPRMGRQDRGRPLRARAERAVPRDLPRPPGRGDRVRARRVRHGRRRLERVQRDERAPGDRICSSRSRTSRTWAARCGSASYPCVDQGRHEGVRGVRRAADPRAPPSPLRGEPRVPPEDRSRGPDRVRDVAGRNSSSRSSNCPITRGSSPASSTRSSSPGRTGRTRCSATSSAPPAGAPGFRRSVRPMRERVLASRTVFDGEVLKVRVDEVEAADGHRSTREVVEHGGAVGDRVRARRATSWLVRQYRHATEEVLLEIPAGKLSAGRGSRSSARRESSSKRSVCDRERLEHLATYYTTPGFTNERFHLYFTDDVVPEAGQHRRGRGDRDRTATAVERARAHGVG